jgi:retron-type reverse transcriptase
MLKLIRAFLEAGVMENGLVSPVEEGTPQGGPLSPLLSNLVLDELDRELERRSTASCATRMIAISTWQRAGGEASDAKCHRLHQRGSSSR